MRCQVERILVYCPCSFVLGDWGNHTVSTCRKVWPVGAERKNVGWTCTGNGLPRRFVFVSVRFVLLLLNINVFGKSCEFIQLSCHPGILLFIRCIWASFLCRNTIKNRLCTYEPSIDHHECGLSLRENGEHGKESLGQLWGAAVFQIVDKNGQPLVCVMISTVFKKLIAKV